MSAAAGANAAGPHSTKRARSTSAETGQSLSRRTAGGGNRGAGAFPAMFCINPKGIAMRAIWRLFLAPVILATVTTIAAGPAHQADHVAQAGGHIPAIWCPAGSNWDNIHMRCV